MLGHTPKFTIKTKKEAPGPVPPLSLITLTPYSTLLWNGIQQRCLRLSITTYSVYVSYRQDEIHQHVIMPPSGQLLYMRAL